MVGWMAFRRGLRRSDPAACEEPCASPSSLELDRSRLDRSSTTPSIPLGWQRAWLRWRLLDLFFSIWGLRVVRYGQKRRMMIQFAVVSLVRQITVEVSALEF